jgi:D-glycero-D-manno-heptose 1,7-bisphosphate phosphatase
VKPRAVFLDRDGVVNELVPDPITGLAESPLHADEVRLVKGVGSSLKTLRRAGYRLACVTNQPAVAKGVVAVDQLLAVQGRVQELLSEVGVEFDAVRMCLHHPEGVVSELAVSCGCRKPEPGMLLSAATELGVDMTGSWMIGDTHADVAAGQTAGCRTVLVSMPGSLHKRTGPAVCDAEVPDLAAAVSIIVPTQVSG